MAEDVVDDEEWQHMLAEFSQHFWLKRAPAFAQAWEACARIAPEFWGDDLKRSVHGLAGVAALVGQEALGDLARDIERRWDDEGANTRLCSDLQLLAEQMAAAERAHFASLENG
ncbi:MAG: hypothetical protein V4730_11190 [Pseudomonadota bacterium]